MRNRFFHNILTIFTLSILFQFGLGSSVLAEEARSIEEKASESIEYHMGPYQAPLAAEILQTKYEESVRQFYVSLSAEQKEKFQANRKMMLTGIEKSLRKVRWGLGFGQLVGEKLSFTKQKIKGIFIQDQSIQEHVDKQVEIEEEFLKKTLKERGDLVLKATLSSIDKQLWAQAPIVARSNEFGVSAAVGLQALGGVGSRGLGGIVSLGLNIGFNRDSQALVFQTYIERESYQSTLMKAVFVAGVNGKLGIVVSNQRELMESQNNKGASFYPPIIPGFSTTSANHFSSGLSSGLTFPPSPIGDMLTFTNSSQQNVLIRVAVSPLLKGFIRVKVLGMGALERTIESLRETFDFTLGTKSCRKVWLSI